MVKRALMLTLLLAGCDSSEALPYVPTYDPTSNEPVSSTEFCALLARNTCAVLRPCCQSGPFAFDESKCRNNARMLCEARKQKSMELGLLYDDVQAGRCVHGTAILMRECRIVNDDPVAADVVEACREVLHGTRALGMPCEGRSPVECAPPALGARVTCRGRCVPLLLAQGGEACFPGSVECVAGLWCDASSASGRCLPVITPPGSPCNACPSGPCPADARCGLDHYCDPSSRVCAALPTKGQPCDPRGCARPWRCDTDKSGNQVCTDGKALGATCNENDECASRFCIGTGIKLCAPAPMGAPIATGYESPSDYLARTAAACDGIIPDGAGGLAPLLPFPAGTD